MIYSRLLKPILIALTILLNGGLLSAQSKDSIVGVWHVEAVTAIADLNAEDQVALSYLKNIFSKSTFTFKASQQVVVTADDPEFKIDNGYWEYTADQQRITITEWKDRMQKKRGILMDIFLKKESDGTTYFYLDETPIKLRVKK